MSNNVGGSLQWTYMHNVIHFFICSNVISDINAQFRAIDKFNSGEIDSIMVIHQYNIILTCYVCSYVYIYGQKSSSEH